MWVTLLFRVRRSNQARDYVQPGSTLKLGPKETAARFASTSDLAYEVRLRDLKAFIKPNPGVEAGFEWDLEEIEIPDAP
jgi:hypothetical protein